ncbi:putative gustatory receptor clone PTE03 [Myripristis murdjan]|uniref:Olfactory receptor n=1 Tax=Myripristis murdjan TaxID=586833 RepID=A0A667X439_9TELE|nr:putative gustatory receptor clone PTE03 [Myripristis murdjan]
MDNRFNTSYLTLGGYVDVHKYGYFYFAFMLTISIVIISSNSVIVYLICVHRSLHEPMYIFIAALLMNSVLFCTTFYPKLLTDFLSEKQIISYPLCIFQAFFHYSFGGSEVFLLTAMAFDRYVCICKPLQYPTIMRTQTIKLILVLAWLVPACELTASAVLATKLKLCRFFMHQKVNCDFYSLAKLTCGDTSVIHAYGLFLLINLIFVPVVFIVFSYTKILIITFNGSRNKKKKAMQTCLPHLLALINISTLSGFETIRIRVKAPIPQTNNFILYLLLIGCSYVFNPFIYGLKMKEISKRLKALLCQNNLD